MTMAAMPQVETLSFEQALEELDALVRRMESGQLGLDDSIAAYKRGAELLKYCQTALQDAQDQAMIFRRALQVARGDKSPGTRPAL